MLMRMTRELASLPSHSFRCFLAHLGGHFTRLPIDIYIYIYSLVALARLLELHLLRSEELDGCSRTSRGLVSSSLLCVLLLIQKCWQVYQGNPIGLVKFVCFAQAVVAVLIGEPHSSHVNGCSVGIIIFAVSRVLVPAPNKFTYVEDQIDWYQYWKIAHWSTGDHAGYNYVVTKYPGCGYFSSHTSISNLALSHGKGRSPRLARA